MKNLIQNTWRFFSLPSNWITFKLMAVVSRPLHRKFADALEGECWEACKEFLSQQNFPPMSKEDFLRNGELFRVYITKCFEAGQRAAG